MFPQSTIQLRSDDTVTIVVVLLMVMVLMVICRRVLQPCCRVSHSLKQVTACCFANLLRTRETFDMELKKYPIGFHFLLHKENFENSNGSSTLLRAVQFYVIILTLFETCEGVNHQKKIIHIRSFLGGAESELFLLFIAG